MTEVGRPDDRMSRRRPMHHETNKVKGETDGRFNQHRRKLNHEADETAGKKDARFNAERRKTSFDHLTELPPEKPARPPGGTALGKRRGLKGKKKVATPAPVAALPEPVNTGPDLPD